MCINGGWAMRGTNWSIAKRRQVGWQHRLSVADLRQWTSCRCTARDNVKGGRWQTRLSWSLTQALTPLCCGFVVHKFTPYYTIKSGMRSLGDQRGLEAKFNGLILVLIKLFSFSYIFVSRFWQCKCYNTVVVLQDHDKSKIYSESVPSLGCNKSTQIKSL